MNKLIPVLVVILSLCIFSSTSVSREDILKKPEWKKIYDEFTFESSLIESIKEKSGNFSQIDIYFGYWCGDSENNVPGFIKILDQLALNDLKVNYYSLGRKKSGEKYFVKNFKIEKVPTFIFYSENKETGRIIENPKESLLTDFLEIVF
ncbi:MAG: thioredoxin family protein [Acidobacteriota bacterium]